MCPAIDSGIVTGNAPVSHWPFPCPQGQSQKSLRKLTLLCFVLVTKVINEPQKFESKLVQINSKYSHLEQPMLM